MASVNFGSATLGQVDEKYFLEAKTELIVNKSDIRLDWHGKNSLTIYQIQTVSENDYVRANENRFGTATELADTQQVFTLSQDKAVNITIDRGNLEDSDLVRDAKKHSMRQVREVSVPTTDKYRLNTAFAYAVANSQGATAATTSSNIFSKFLDQQVQLGENLVPEDGRVAFFTYAAAAKLKQDAQYKLNCDASYADVKKGVISMVDGCKIVVVPSSYLPANSTFLLIHEEVLIAPTKFNLIRILTEQKDIDGVYLQMRRYYDCFIPTNKGVAIRFHKES